MYYFRSLDLMKKIRKEAELSSDLKLYPLEEIVNI